MVVNFPLNFPEFHFNDDNPPVQLRKLYFTISNPSSYIGAIHFKGNKNKKIDVEVVNE